MSHGPQTLDPDKLTFLAKAYYVRDGHGYVTATYPSWSKKGTRHKVSVRDDGQAVGCQCTGYNTHKHCYHLDNAEEIAREWRRRECRGKSSADLWREDSFLAHSPAGSLDAAQRIFLDAIGDVVAERYAAKHGHVGRFVAPRQAAS